MPIDEAALWVLAREHEVDQFLDVTHCAPGTGALRCQPPTTPFLGATVNVTPIAATGGEEISPIHELVLRTEAGDKPIR